MLGKPDMTVIAFASKEVNIYKVNAAMSEKGWSLNALHKPERYLLSNCHMEILDTGPLDLLHTQLNVCFFL